jgi:competence protein ComEA
MFKKILIFLLALGFAVSANAAKVHKRHRRGAKTVATAQMLSDKVNINQAGAKELAGVKGLGTKKAKAIIAYRKANGNFKSVDDLTNVKGIGEKRLAKIKSNLTV